MTTFRINIVLLFVTSLLAVNETVAQEVTQTHEINAGSYLKSELAFDTGDLFMELTSNEVTDERIATQTRVFPNPVADVLQVVSDKPIESIAIYSLDGKAVYTAPSPQNTIDLKYLTTGLYLVVINQEENFKIVKL
ncbi:MAG TPA: T9SS type A sorting domain-containing protein [Flavobacterium sp.]|nr:T9SS type A sorting domain-containing protein [Flavobacterium sp.]